MATASRRRLFAAELVDLVNVYRFLLCQRNATTVQSRLLNPVVDVSLRSQHVVLQYEVGKYCPGQRFCNECINCNDIVAES